jgi:hypothetical protein
MRKDDLKDTQEWLLYENGIDYKHKINLFEIVDKNERMYVRRPMEWGTVKRPANTCVQHNKTCASV